MAYRRDPDLEFLGNVPSADLDALVRILTKREDGAEHLTGELTMCDRYKESSPDHHAYWDLIAAEIQCFGANTLATLGRGGEGVLYREVLTDVCDKKKVNYNDGSSVEIIEHHLLTKVLIDSMKEMSPEELEAVCDDLNLSPMRYTPEVVTIALQMAIRLGGFVPYKVALIVANNVAKAFIGRGLSLTANAALVSRMSAFAGPMGWAFSAVWLLVDIAAPAYRITIPAVIMVAYLRAAESAKREMEEKKWRKKEKKRLKKRVMKKLEKKKRLDQGKDHSSEGESEG